MKTAKVSFKDPAHNYATNINGTDEEIREYFLNNLFNVGIYPEEKLRKPIKVEILSHLMTLAQQHDFNTAEEYNFYIVDSLINGQRQQVKELFNDMQPDDQISFLNNFLDQSPAIYTREIIKEVRNICIQEAINNKIGLDIVY